MSSKVLLNSSELTSEYIFNILSHLKVKVKIKNNDFQIPPELLFQMAARINKKRAFLFVSKVLGKHLPVKPETPLLASSILASKYLKEVLHENDEQLSSKLDELFNSMDKKKSKRINFRSHNLPEKTIFIGFAETATALGHAVFENFHNAFFFHTTRESIDNKSSVIHFEEEHSHATAHYCYIDSYQLDNQNPIVLIDDELTTGKTVLNIIQSIQNNFPRYRYTILTLLDWRSEESIQKFSEMENQLGIEIRVVSLVSGQIEVESQYQELKEKSDNISKNIESLGTIAPVNIEECKVQTSPYYHSKSSKANYLWETGRFGLDSANHKNVDQLTRKIAHKICSLRTGGKTLCLGTGEFMYLPMKIATYMGDEIYFQSTTRSPIYAVNKKDYLIQHKHSFPCPGQNSIANYFYQIQRNLYDEVFVFFERKLPESEMLPLLEQLASLISKVYTVTISKGEDEVINAFNQSHYI